MNYFHNIGLTFIPSSKEILKSFLVANGIYGLWIVLHFISANMYADWCAPKSIVGFLTSPLLSSSPHCTGLRWIINEGANSINAMWLILGTWFIGSFVTIKKPTFNKLENTKIS